MRDAQSVALKQLQLNAAPRDAKQKALDQKHFQCRQYSSTRKNLSFENYEQRLCLYGRNRFRGNGCEHSQRCFEV